MSIFGEIDKNRKTAIYIRISTSMQHTDRPVESTPYCFLYQCSDCKGFPYLSIIHCGAVHAGLAGRRDSKIQRPITIYSYENTIVAELDGKVVGAMCTYDGADYQRLKQPIVDVLRADSGFASSLFEAQCERAASLGHKVAGLIIDVDKPQAEALYARLGFTYLDDKDIYDELVESFIEVHHLNPIHLFDEQHVVE